MRKDILKKIKYKINSLIVSKTKSLFFYPILYRSYWHYLRSDKKKLKKDTEKRYFASVPNQGAGIGHQLANWNAGYWFAKKFKLNFVHIPFSNPTWETLLGFSENTKTYKELHNQGYKNVILPLFNEKNKKEVTRIENIIKSYVSEKVIFLTEQDQFYFDQFGVIEDIQKLFYSSASRINDNILYDSKYFNIAIHVRRGDISIGQLNKNPNLLMRWQDNNYFINVLNNIIEELDINKEIKIYLFSQGVKKDFCEFNEFKNLVYCLDMTAEDSFLHMVYADLLITSKSSFSYKPALLSKGIKVSPKNFWHGYPLEKDWILAEEDGNLISSNILKKLN